MSKKEPSLPLTIYSQILLILIREYPISILNRAGTLYIMVIFVEEEVSDSKDDGICKLESSIVTLVCWRMKHRPLGRRLLDSHESYTKIVMFDKMMSFQAFTLRSVTIHASCASTTKP